MTHLKEDLHCAVCGAFYTNNGACGDPECCGANYDYATCDHDEDESRCYGDRTDCVLEPAPSLDRSAAPASDMGSNEG